MEQTPGRSSENGAPAGSPEPRIDMDAYLEESVAYSAFLAAGEPGAEACSFQDFLRRYRSAASRARPASWQDPAAESRSADHLSLPLRKRPSPLRAWLIGAALGATVPVAVAPLICPVQSSGPPKMEAPRSVMEPVLPKTVALPSAPALLLSRLEPLPEPEAAARRDPVPLAVSHPAQSTALRPARSHVAGAFLSASRRPLKAIRPVSHGVAPTLAARPQSWMLAMRSERLLECNLSRTDGLPMGTSHYGAC